MKAKLLFRASSPSLRTSREQEYASVTQVDSVFTKFHQGFYEMPVSMSSGHERPYDGHADVDLARRGYAAELPRHLSMMSIFGLSFAIIAVPFGLSTTLYIPLINGQCVTIIWGWFIMSIISTCIAASLAEICAVFPTAGGVYYWSALLSSESWAPLASWITGWLYLVGNLMSTCAITFGGAQLILSAPALFRDDWLATPWQTVLTFWAILLVCLLINIFGVKLLDKLNQACIYWTGATVFAVLIALLAMCKNKKSAEFVFTHFDSSQSGWPSGWSFCIGLLQATFTLTGYGMVAVMCEEVQCPEREVPRAMVYSVVASGITGLVYLIPILFVLPDIQTLLTVASGQPIGILFRDATGSKAAGLALLILVIGVMFFAGVGALTTASRCAWALARDKAVPGYQLWRKVDDRVKVPLYALLLSVGVIGVMGLIYLGSSAAFNAFTGATTICLSACFVAPVLISLIQRRQHLEHSLYPLGRFGYLFNIISVAWVAFAIVLFCMPNSLPTTATTMNYTSVVFCGFGAISVIYYYVHGHKVFTGPPTRDVVVIDARETDAEDVGPQSIKVASRGSMK
ncbi:Polyamine transporter TPO5 [Exophiala dermatitidis]